MSNQMIGYKKGAHQANAGVAPTDDGRFQGVVDLLDSGPGNAARHVVPVTSDSAEEALDEAKALAHRLLADLQ